MFWPKSLHSNRREAGVNTRVEAINTNDPNSIKDLTIGYSMYSPEFPGHWYTFAPMESFSKAARSTNEKQKKVDIDPMTKTENWYPNMSKTLPHRIRQNPLTTCEAVYEAEKKESELMYICP